jgi:CheY-like chemotaxis protein
MECVCETAFDGKEAVDKVKKHPYDCILMDVQMPVMGGYEAAKIIRESGNAVPIIALTAHAFKEEEENCRASGMNDFLSKPVKIEALKEKVLTWGAKRQ